jgi:hypothetical protein
MRVIPSRENVSKNKTSLRAIGLKTFDLIESQKNEMKN